VRGCGWALASVNVAPHLPSSDARLGPCLCPTLTTAVHSDNSTLRSPPVRCVHHGRAHATAALGPRAPEVLLLLRREKARHQARAGPMTQASAPHNCPFIRPRMPKATHFGVEASRSYAWNEPSLGAATCGRAHTRHPKSVSCPSEAPVQLDTEGAYFPRGFTAGCPPFKGRTGLRASPPRSKMCAYRAQARARSVQVVTLRQSNARDRSHQVGGDSSR
jgi:hypothetical protein